MLNEILLAKFENEVSGKEVTFPAREKKALKRKYEKYFGDGKWRGSIFDLYLQFLEQQEEKGKAVEVPENSFDVYDLAALAYLYKRIKENESRARGEPCGHRRGAGFRDDGVPGASLLSA